MYGSFDCDGPCRRMNIEYHKTEMELEFCKMVWYSGAFHYRKYTIVPYVHITLEVKSIVQIW